MSLRPESLHSFQTRLLLQCGLPFPKATSMWTCVRSLAHSIRISFLLISIRPRGVP